MFHDTKPAHLSDDGEIDPWAPFRVANPVELNSLLRQVRDASAPVILATSHGTAVTCTLWAIDATQGRLSWSADGGQPQMQALIDADEAAAVCYLESVKLQFDLEDFVLVRSLQSMALQSSMPRDLYRFQRRQSFRVRPGGRNAPSVTLRHPSMPDMTLALRVLDLSVGGCALLLPPDVPELRPGVTLHGVEVQLDSETSFVTALQIQHVSSMQLPEGSHRLGCQWQQLGTPAERLLQRYVNQTQKRHRLLSLS